MLFNNYNYFYYYAPAMIDIALESCCFLCNRAIYEGPYDHLQLVFLENVSFAIPAQTSIKSQEYMSHNFIHLVPVSNIGIFGIPPKSDPVKNGKTLVYSIAGTYPLLIIVLLMCVTAGVAVWILVSIAFQIMLIILINHGDYTTMPTRQNIIIVNSFKG